MKSLDKKVIMTDYQNQYSEFLKKNMIYEEEPRKKKINQQNEKERT